MHTRISEQLADDIRRVAEDLRVPVSNLVRNALEEAFTVAETVTENVGDLIEDVLDDAERVSRRVRHSARHWAEEQPPACDASPADAETQEEEEDAEPRPEFPDIVGWQPLILNQQGPCADCGRDLVRGERAFAGLTAGGLSQTMLCRACLEARG